MSNERKWSPAADCVSLTGVRCVTQENDKNVTKLRQQYEREVKELQQKYELKMKLLREDLELRRKVCCRRARDERSFG